MDNIQKEAPDGKSGKERKYSAPGEPGDHGEESADRKSAQTGRGSQTPE